MTKNTSIIVFTYKRAFQLDAFIKSAVENFPYLNFPINIIYQHDEIHKESYEKLFLKWAKYINVHQRGNKTNLLNSHELLRPLNILWYLRFSWLRKYYDDFKDILLKIIIELKTPFLILSTDDQVFYKNVFIHEKIFETISSSPKKYTMRLTSNFKFKDENIKKNINKYQIDNYKYLYWKASKQPKNTFWKYRFNVDGTIFETKYLHKFLNKFIFNMPTTLESIGLWESRFRDYYNECLGSHDRSFVGLQLSNIQTTINTPSAKFDLNYLMKLYLEDFYLKTSDLEINEEKYIFIPSKIPISNSSSNYFLYENNKLVNIEK